MFTYRQKPPSKKQRTGGARRRALLVAGVAICLTAGALAAAAPAYACDNTTHCYGITGYSHSGILGVNAKIAPISGPGVSTASFATDEIWLVATNSSYWVETGYIFNFTNVNGLDQGLSLFWFDSKPGGGAHGHELLLNPSKTARNFIIFDEGNGEFSAGDDDDYGFSENNTMTPVTAEVGSEVTTASSCSWAHDYSMGYSVGSGWAPFSSPWTSTNSPQKLTWISSPTNMDAGVQC